MKPVPVLIAIVSLGVALSLVSWVSQGNLPNPEQTSQPPEQSPPAKNPLEIAETGPFPKAVLDEATYDFGAMEFGQENSHNFVVRNEGEAPLTLAVGFVQCKCTVAEVPKDGIPPGESVEINLKWKPVDPAEEFHKTADIWTNDPENPKLVLTIQGEVTSIGFVLPPKDWRLDILNNNEPSRFSGMLVSPIVEEFQITDYETSSDFITVEFTPLTKEEAAAVDAKSGYMINGTLDGDLPVGRFQAKITLMTDMAGGRDFTIPLQGTRPGPFSMLGKQNWFGGEMLLRMGDVKSSAGKVETVSMFVTPEEEPLEIFVKKSNPEFLQLTIERDEKFSAAATREKYVMTFTVPPGSPVGSWPDDEPATIRIGTNRKNAEEFEIHVALTVTE